MVNIFKYLPARLLNDLIELENKVDSNSKFIKSILYDYKFISTDDLLVDIILRYESKLIKYCTAYGAVYDYINLPNLIGLKISLLYLDLSLNHDLQQHLTIKSLEILGYRFINKPFHQELSCLINLECLTIQDVRILDDVLNVLPKLSHLKSLTLIDCHACDGLYQKLSECQNLKILKLERIKSLVSYHPVDIDYLAKLKLVELSMVSVSIYVISTYDIGKITTLNKLTVINSGTLYHLEAHMKELINLRYLEINDHYKNYISSKIVIGLPYLRSINLIQDDGSKIGIAINLTERDNFKWP